jgi:hypothetical protein
VTLLRQRVLLGAALCLAVMRPGQAHAFAEDVCFPGTGGAAQNCSTLPNNCLPAGVDTLPCRVSATAAFVLEGSSTTGARSTIHADATHMFAQAVGFSAENAYWMAAYNEVADYGVFEPYDEQGQVYGDGGMKTAELNGFVRTNLPSGGMLYHFHAPYNGGMAQPPTGIDGLHPDVTNANAEVFLAHMRAWALAGSGQNPPQCAGGLTELSAQSDYAHGAACYSANGGPVTIHGAISAVASGDIPFNLQSGLQVVATYDGGVKLSSEFDALVGNQAARVAAARLGLYLHSFADRVSHHRCDDLSVLTGPQALTDGGWNVDMTNADCAQGYHALRHMWETGVAFGVLAAADRTTEAALPLIYDELMAFAEAQGVAAPDAAARKAGLVASVVAALQTQDAQQRIVALANVACGQGLLPFPGMAACADAGHPGDAGVAADAAGASSSSSSSGGGSSSGSSRCACATAADGVPLGCLVFLGVALLVQRRVRPVGHRASGHHG